MATTVLMRAAPAHLIEQFAPKPTAVTPGVVEGAVDVWSGGTGGEAARATVETGIWEASPGSFTASREGYHEICYLLSGRVTLVETGEEPLELTAGDLFVTPAGWNGVWHVHETVRKVFVVVTV